jgi:hypothetical protein
MLTSNSKRIRTYCCQVLCNNYDEIILDQVRAVYRSGNPVHKKTVLSLLNKIGGWKVVADLINALPDENQEVSDMGWTFLFKWKIRAVSNFTVPSPKDIDRAKEAYHRIAHKNISMTYYRAKLWEELPFYLRS